MAAVQPPVAIQTGGETPALLRLLIGDLLGSGVVGAAALAVTAQPTPAMSVQVAAGRVVVAGTQATLQGSYFCLNDGPVTVTVSPANATNPRKDLVVARVSDSFYSGTANVWAVEVVTGTPAGSPTEPAAPPNSVVLALVDVPANATSITNSNITDRRPFARLPLDAHQRAYGRVTRIASGLLQSVTESFFAFDAVDYTAGMTAKTSGAGDDRGLYLSPGLWALTARVLLVGGGVTQRVYGRIYDGATQLIQNDQEINANTKEMEVSTLHRVTAGTPLIRVLAYQNSGSAAEYAGSRLTAVRLGPA